MSFIHPSDDSYLALNAQRTASSAARAWKTYCRSRNDTTTPLPVPSTAFLCRWWRVELLDWERELFDDLEAFRAVVLRMLA